MDVSQHFADLIHMTEKKASWSEFEELKSFEEAKFNHVNSKTHCLQYHEYDRSFVLKCFLHEQIICVNHDLFSVAMIKLLFRSKILSIPLPQLLLARSHFSSWLMCKQFLLVQLVLSLQVQHPSLENALPFKLVSRIQFN